MTGVRSHSNFVFSSTDTSYFAFFTPRSELGCTVIRMNAKSVDAYLASSGIKARPKLEELRNIIKSTIPKVEEGINWGFPFYKYHGTLAHFAEYKNHVALGFGSDLQNKDHELLEKNGYATGQKRIQIKFDQKVPVTVIKQILKAQAKMNAAKTLP